ncbi:NADH-dependent flavin oxidoreductase [Mycoplasma miroungirhinis]|uniref:NADH-dependent flavin oxidoreductase n=1 Tax=Mycoplasma miroungirhinis TaxID=754516 RepID=A0A6M4JE11_9MOLU|nr:NADH-dependent flavin oxidoreductase [Mycoplasma miroungirhinis]QJR44269.1 NADH-dependent flavin oxidoreductase [Mycoplasma miroungirhinis]
MIVNKNNKYKQLLEPFYINNFKLKNRFVLSPMTLHLTTKDGKMTQEEIAYAKRRAYSAPLQITGGAYIDDFGQLFEYSYSAKSDEDIKSLAQLAAAMKTSENKVILQLAHAGKFSKASLNKYGYTYGPSYEKHHWPFEHEVFEMSKEQIKDVVLAYQKATLRAIKAGFDGVEISMAQKLLIQTFFSQIINKRSDEYSSQNFENRCRLALEIVKAIRQTINENAPQDFIFGFRATPEETYGSELGYTIDDFNKLMDLIIKEGAISYLAIASWGHNIYLNKVRSESKFKGELVNKVVYQHINHKVPVIASGGINTPQKCLDALKYSDLIGLSSVFVADPEFVSKIENDEIDKINLKITQDQLLDLAIPQHSFSGVVNMFGYCETIPNETMNALENNANNN